jgi:radical SAM superfamily enzyme YgiQ (UPF0313 family)
MRIEDFRDFKLENPLFVGISSMSGRQIRYALEFAKKVRTSNPSVPIIWGGVHPTLLPEQTIANEYVDVIVRGEGESPVVELANALKADMPLNDVKSITFKSHGMVRHNPDGPLIDLDSIPLDLPFDLLHMNRYPSLGAGRFHIQTSRGCPHPCGFCYNSIFNKRRWRGKSPKRVLDEIEYILQRFPQVKCIDPIDDNFFVDKRRVAEICRGILKRKLNVTWRANCRFDYVANYDKDFIGLLEKSGCVELDFGAETGSERLLTLIDKEVTPEQMLKAVENLKKGRSSIEPYVSWMSGLPTEIEEDLKKTLDLMDKMCEVNPKTQHFGIFVYTPFPCPLVNSVESEFTPPQSLEEWGKVEMFQFTPPWHSKKYVEKLHAISAVTRYAFYPETRMNERSIAYRTGYRIINRMAKFRWRHRYFGFPIDLKIVNAMARRFRGYV